MKLIKVHIHKASVLRCSKTFTGVLTSSEKLDKEFKISSSKRPEEEEEEEHHCEEQRGGSGLTVCLFIKTGEQS